jgi:ATP-dependent DNA ligase
VGAVSHAAILPDDSGQGSAYIPGAMPVLRFIEPCLLSPADRPPSGSGWLHEIKHDGYRLMARAVWLRARLKRRDQTIRS